MVVKVIYQEMMEWPFARNGPEFHQRAVVATRIQPIKERGKRLASVSGPEERGAQINKLRLPPQAECFERQFIGDPFVIVSEFEREKAAQQWRPERARRIWSQDER